MPFMKGNLSQGTYTIVIPVFIFQQIFAVFTPLCTSSSLIPVFFTVSENKLTVEDTSVLKFTL